MVFRARLGIFKKIKIIIMASQEKKISKISLTEQLNQKEYSMLRKYQAKVIGNNNFLYFLGYELATL
jgi:hypothetical protein